MKWTNIMIIGVSEVLAGNLSSPWFLFCHHKSCWQDTTCSYMYVLCSINLGYHYHGKKRSRSGPTSTDSDVCTVIQTSRTLNQVFVLIRLRLGPGTNHRTKRTGTATYRPKWSIDGPTLETIIDVFRIAIHDLSRLMSSSLQCGLLLSFCQQLQTCIFGRRGKDAKFACSLCLSSSPSSVVNLQGSHTTTYYTTQPQCCRI